MSIDAFFERIKAEAADRYQDEQEQGLHDRECEWDIDFRMCHCPKRRREAAGRTELPTEDLDFTPACPECYRYLHHNGDSWVCDHCHIMWDSDGRGESAEWTDDHGDISWCEEHQRRACTIGHV